MQFQRFAISALVVALCVSGCGKGGPGAGGPGGAAKAPALNVDVAKAQRQDIGTTISLDGQIAPLEQSTLSFQQSGPVAAVYVNVGDHVSAGQLLAKIDDSTLRAQAAQAQAQAAQQAASAQGAVIGLPVQQQQNNAQLSTARAALDNARLVYQQNLQLYHQGYVSQSALEQSRAGYVQAQNAYNSAQISLRNNDVSAQNVRAAQAGASAAAAAVTTLNTQIAQTALYAPYAGVITQRNLDPGAMASPGTPALAISRVDTVWINMNVPDEDLAFVHEGSQVNFTSSSLPGKKFVAHVSSVNAVPTQGTLSYLARVTMPNPGDVLRGGMLVTATIRKEFHRGAIVVPRSAVAQSDTGSTVYIVQDGNKAKSVPVRVGIQTDTLSEVISGQVQPGTTVITTRPDALKDGATVAVNSPSNGNATNNGGAH